MTVHEATERYIYVMLFVVVDDFFSVMLFNLFFVLFYFVVVVFLFVCFLQ